MASAMMSTRQEPSSTSRLKSHSRKVPLLLHPGMAAEYCDERVCLPVCLFVGLALCPWFDLIKSKFLCMSP